MEKTVRIESNEEFGRHVVANENIEAGELVVDEPPFALGPKQNSFLMCLGCYSPMDETVPNSKCIKCGWPLCANCSNSIVHSGECEVFSQANAKFQGQNDEGFCPQLDAIVPLRVLLKKEADPERWEREVAPMEYHDKPRRENEEIWNADLVNVARYLRGPCKLDRFSEDLIMQVIGILEVNAFEARTSQGYAIRCLYPLTGILAHSCIPNTTRAIYPTENYRIKLRAMVDIKKGEQLNHSYTYTLSGTAARQEHLKAGKYFTCRCKRCTDPTELGTHFSSFKCNKCDPGLILTTDPLNPTAEWKCSNCDFKTSGNAIQKAVAVMQAEIDQVQEMDMTSERLESTERLFRKYRSILHPLHFIQTSLRQSLIEMYGRVEGYEMSQLPDILLERKEELCRDVLKVLNVFEPGISRSRAMTLYELHAPIVLTAKTGFQLGVLGGEALKKKLQEAVDVLAECANILQFEDPTTPEGNLAFVAMHAMEQLKASIEQVQ